MNSADLVYLQFQIARALSETKLRAAKDRAYRDMARTARAHVQCRITILSEYKSERKKQEPKESA